MFSRVSHKAVEYEWQSQAFYVRKDHQPETSCWLYVLQISAVLVSWTEHQAYFSISANLFVEKKKREGCRSELELIS